MDVDWRFYPGEDLLELMRQKMLSSVIPDVAGIYAWKINPLSRVLLPADTEGILRHLRRLLKLPQGKTSAKQVGPSLYVDGVRLGGKVLEPAKEQNLRRWLADPGNAHWFIENLASVGQMMPTLYVGKADHLVTRVADHLSGKSGFGTEVNADPQLEWRDLVFGWISVPDAGTGVLESLEYVVQSLTVSAFSRRFG